MKKKIFSGPNDFVYFKSEEFQDIDRKDDWELAKILIRNGEASLPKIRKKSYLK